MEETYKLPPEYKVLNVFKHSPIHKGVFILAKKHNKNEWAIYHFDGIDELPMMIETFYEVLSNPTVNK